MYKISLILPRDLTHRQVAFLCGALEEQTLSSSALRENNDKDGEWCMEWISESELSPAALTQELQNFARLDPTITLDIDESGWTIEALEQKNWLEECYRAFPPFSVGPFFIYGSHYEGDWPEGQIPMQIDATTAFGSGEHGTTKGCMEAMLDLKALGVCPWNILDMGTGSGILAIAAWNLWQAPILAADIDDESVRVAQRHCEMNHIKTGNSTVLCAQSDGSQADIVGKKAPYELLSANILAGPLIDMAADLSALLDDNGYIILSGMLHEQAADVLKAYEAQGLKEKNRYERGEWTTLVLQA